MAIKVGNISVATDAEKQLYQNADQIAAFLGNINPNWSTEEWKNILRDHLVLLKEDLCHMLSGNFEDSVGTFTNIESGTLEMADFMAIGIVKQFPQYFR